MIKTDPALLDRINTAVPAEFAVTPESVTALMRGGSDRMFVRAERNGRRFVVLAAAADDPDFSLFEPILRFLWDHGLGVPEPLFAAKDDAVVVMEDLGPRTLKAETGVSAGNIPSLYRQVVDFLVRFQRHGTAAAAPGTPAARRRFDYSMMRWETWYYRVWFLEQFCLLDTGVTGRLTGEFHRLADELAACPPVLMHRDFQAQNIIFSGGRVRIVDFNGARLGPAGYDLASLIYDPYAGLSDDTADELAEYYRARSGRDRDPFTRELQLAAVQRLSQALGAYGYLTMVKKRPGYRRYMEPALRRLTGILETAGGFPDMLLVAGAAAEALRTGSDR